MDVTKMDITFWEAVHFGTLNGNEWNSETKVITEWRKVITHTENIISLVLLYSWLSFSH